MMTLWDGLQPRRVHSAPGVPLTVYVYDDDGPKPFEVWAGSSGALSLKRPEPVPIDQEGERDKRPVRERWATAGFTD